MKNLVGSYGYIKTEHAVISCTDTSYSFDLDGWWCTYLLCIFDDGKNLTLKSHEDDSRITINRDGYEVLGFPAYKVGDDVIVNKSKKFGKVRRVCWHEKRQCFYYKLSYANRDSNNWFFDENIELV